ncbi:MAG: 50S ribosomal protein L13 [Patescibacteria group bacterium]
MEYRIDMKNKPLGRVATEVAIILQGKKHADYDPKNIGKDSVVLENWQHTALTGRKFTEKLYHRHTGYMGHLKTLTFRQAFEKNPRQVIRDTVRRMLPKNFLNQRRLTNLKFANND